MTYETFKQQICEQIQAMLPADARIQLQKVFRNNGLELDGLTISTGNVNVSPTIFLNYYYDKNEENPDFGLICRDILRTYEHNKSEENIDIGFFTDFELAKSHLAYRMINYEKNRELLKTVPHVRYLDLAIVFYCLLEVSRQNNATILIHNSHLDMWHITVSELYEHTYKTTPTLLPYELHNMTGILQSIGKLEDLPQEPSDMPFCSMYVLSNKHKLYGAGCILYPGLLAQIANRLQADLYLLPCSIHEVILLPSQKTDNAGSLRDMVTEINATELSEEEILSNNVYYYAREADAVSICS